MPVPSRRAGGRSRSEAPPGSKCRSGSGGRRPRRAGRRAPRRRSRRSAGAPTGRSSRPSNSSSSHLRDARAAGGREAARRGDVGDGQDARNDLDVDARGRGFVAEAEEAVGGEEELGDRPVGARIDLALRDSRGRTPDRASPGGFRDRRRPRCRTARPSSGPRPARRRRDSLPDAAGTSSRLRADRRAGRRCCGRRGPNSRGRSRRSRRVLAATQVRCAAGVSEVSLRIRSTVWWVRSRVEPPAP